MTYEEIIDNCTVAADEAGLNIDYEPAVMVENIADMSTEEWVKVRQSGIGGSDAGTVMRVNAHRTRTELAKDKLGMLPEKTVDPKLQFIFDYGHQMEAALGNYFGAVTGFQVYTDNRMFYHPFYPWMHGNCDGFATDKDGYKCLLEFKTANPDTKYFWKSGVLGVDAKLYRPEYEWQVRHYMSILNIFRAYIIVGFNNNADDIVVIRVDRDIDKEVALINAEADFWKNFIMKKVVPYETRYSDASYATLKPTTKANPKADRLQLPESFTTTLAEIAKLDNEKSVKNAEIKRLDERINALKLPIEEAMGEAAEGYLTISDKEEYAVTYKPTVRESIPAKEFKLAEPELYDKYRKVSETRTLRVAVKAPKRK